MPNVIATLAPWEDARGEGWRCPGGGVNARGGGGGGALEPTLRISTRDSASILFYLPH